MKQIALMLSLCLLLLAAAVPAWSEENVYTVGVVPQFESRRLHAIWRPILDRVEAATGYKFQLVGSPSIPDFEREFGQGRFDFAYMNPYHLVVANQKAGYLPLVRDRGRQLFGVLVVKKGGGITSPSQLDGKIVAFPAPNALGASLQMRQELVDKFHVTIKPDYVKTHDSVYLNVLLGRAAAGGGVQKTLNQQKQEYRDNLQIIHETDKVAPHPMAVLPSVPEAVRAKVRDALLALGQTDEGKAMLAKIPMKQIGAADMTDYEPLRRMGLERFYVAP
jgi:phosphonate transport system substrate-binding protein